MPLTHEEKKLLIAKKRNPDGSLDIDKFTEEERRDIREHMRICELCIKNRNKYLKKLGLDIFK